jgi:hypothetical protein
MAVTASQQDSAPAAAAASSAVLPSRIPKKTYPPVPSKSHSQHRQQHHHQQQHHQQHQQKQQQQQLPQARSAALSELNSATAAAATATAQGLSILRSMVSQLRDLLASIVASLHRFSNVRGDYQQALNRIGSSGGTQSVTGHEALNTLLATMQVDVSFDFKPHAHSRASRRVSEQLCHCAAECTSCAPQSRSRL